MQETIITSQGGLNSIRHTISTMRSNARMTWELSVRMFIRDMQAMYRQSLLGYVWILLPPLANSLVWIYLNQQKVITVDTAGASYPIFVLTGTLIWTAFNGTLTGMLTAVQASRNIISKINFPHEALLLSSFGKACVSSLIPFVLLLPMLPFYMEELSWRILLFPIGVMMLMLLATTIAIFLLPIATLYTDTGRGVQLLLRFLFFLTPVVYPLPQAGLAKIITDLNPITPLLVTTRSWVMGEGPVMLQEFYIFAAVLPIALVVGVLIYKISIPYLIERLSA